MKILAYLILILLSHSADAQTEMPCEIINQICGNEKIQKSLKLDHSDIPIVLVTDSAEFSTCGSKNFGTHKTSIIHNDSILRKGRLYSKFRDNCSYYLVWNLRKKDGNSYLLDIVQLCSSLECEVTVRRNGNSYKVVKVDTYVL